MLWRSLRPFVIGGAVVLVGLILVLAVRSHLAKGEWETKKDELRALAARAKPILDALEGHRQDWTVYPDELEDLVPDYLPSVPDTGPPFSAPWGYSVASNGTVYDLYVRVPRDYCLLVMGVLHFDDYFVHRSNQIYATAEYGGILEPIGDWAYYHE